MNTRYHVLSQWSGNTIFAYPDLAISLSGNPETVFPGDSFEYVLNFGNQGYDEAEEVTVKIEFPKGVNYEGDTSGMEVSCAGQECVWNVGSLPRLQTGNFQIRVKVDPNFFSLNQTSFWEKLIPKVYAAEEAASFVVKTSISTPVPESDDSNNSSAVTITVSQPAVGGVNFGESEGVDQREPILEITAKNNVNEFVYPGDTVTFEVIIKNKADVRAEDVFLKHSLYNGVPEDLGVADIPIGTIEPGKTAKVTFGMTLANEELHAGSYHTLSRAFGLAPNGKEVESDEARTDFKIRLKELASFFEAKAVEKKEEEVLGAKTSCPIVPKESSLPYVLLLVLSSLWVVERGRRLSKKYLVSQEND